MGTISINVTPQMNRAFLMPEEEELLAIYFGRFYNLGGL
jgi:hypothetical protein